MKYAATAATMKSALATARMSRAVGASSRTVEWITVRRTASDAMNANDRASGCHMAATTWLQKAPL